MGNNEFKELCLAEKGKTSVLQGNIAFAVGCVRAGIHCADGYPGTPSSEVIDNGLSRVQDMIKVGWSVNEAVAVGVGFGHTLAGEDSVVTMKIPGLFQAGDLFTSSAFFTDPRGALIYYIATDFVPSATQHVIDPRYLLKSTMIPVFEPRNHQELLEAAGIAADIGRTYRTPVAVLASGILCHSEGLVRLNEIKEREILDIPGDLNRFNPLPGITRGNYDTVMAERIPALTEMVEKSPLNRWIKGSGRKGVITYGVCSIYVEEVRDLYGEDFDILSLAFTNPLPNKLIGKFSNAIDGDIYIIEDGFHFVQDELERMGLSVTGKEYNSSITEWTPELIAERLGYSVIRKSHELQPVIRPPMICAGCPYRLFAEVVNKLKKQDKIDIVFGDIGCYALLYFIGAMDLHLAMGAGESMRQGFVLSRPELNAKCLSIVGDSTECHSGMDATRNAVFRNIPGVKVVLDNYWTAMTGGQPSPASPVNLAGEKISYDLDTALKSHSDNVFEVNAYDMKGIRKTIKEALSQVEQGKFSVVVVRGSCVKKVPNKQKGIQLKINQEKCDQCHICQICSGIEEGPEGFPRFNNLCSGCGGENPACMQMCPFDAMEPLTEDDNVRTAAPGFPEPPGIEKIRFDNTVFPERLSLAIRGVGGQGNLFFGRVLTQLAFLAGYDAKNIAKGETHGMAQMGGPVISTFSCGKVHSPVLFPESADCLIVMEMSEVFRPGFIDLLKKDGRILMAKTKIVPQALDEEKYPKTEDIKKALGDYDVMEVDVLGRALELGDSTGRIANVIMIGVLSRIAPFDIFPEDLWLQALKNVNPKPDIFSANYTAFISGRELV
ncbi:2-oxoacid:acceptor oxidoreductase family protein [Thermodesulfobacteriota bacterium]